MHGFGLIDIGLEKPQILDDFQWIFQICQPKYSANPEEGPSRDLGVRRGQFEFLADISIWYLAE